MSDDHTEASSWSRLNEIPRVCLEVRNLRQTVTAGIVVGTLLFLINQSQAVFSGQATPATWVRVVLTYLVPFVVANYGIVIASRRRPR